MFDVVVVGADSSETSKRAVEAASAIAAMAGGALHIVTAFDRKSYSELSVPAEYRSLDHEGEVDAMLQVHSFIAKKHGLEPFLHKEVGDAADVIIKKAAELGADLVVVGNRGMKGVRRVLGSVPNSVVHGADCSVAIIDTSA